MTTLVIYPLNSDRPLTQKSLSEAILKKKKKFISMFRGEFMAPVNTGLLGAPLLFLILTGQQHLRDPSLFLNHCGASVDLGVPSLESFGITVCLRDSGMWQGQ